MICSKCSFLYPLNDWVDVNIYFTIGKGMMAGRIPYRDLYDQKGIVVFLLYGLASLVDSSSMIGVYCLEVLSFAGFLFFSCKTIRLFYDGSVLAAIPLLGMLILPSLCFSHGGSMEEFCLLPYSVTLYDMLRYYRLDYPSRPPRFRMLLKNGFLAGLILFSKFNLLAFYFGFMAVLVLSLWARRQFRRGWISAAAFLLGMFLASVPCIAYFLFHNAGDYLFRYYFYGNVFSYSYIDPPVLPNTILAILRFTCAAFYRNLQFSFLIVLGILFFTRAPSVRIGLPGKISLWAMAVLTAAAVYCGGQGFRYYAIVFAVFCPLGLVPLLAQFKKKIGSRISPRWRRLVPSALSVAGLLVCLVFTDNAYLLLKPREETPQYRFAAEMNQLSGENPVRLLNYGFPDSGFYLAANVLPENRFFSTTNQPMPEISEEQQYMLREGLVDFAVTRDRTDPPAENYVLIDTASLYYEEETSTYRLYQRIPVKEAPNAQ